VKRLDLGRLILGALFAAAIIIDVIPGGPDVFGFA
jgi:hypothetical protein